MLPTITVAEWLAALRSGKYRQGQRQLRSPNGYYCCLGVGAELCGTLDINAINTISHSPYFPHKFLSDLPESMWENVDFEKFSIRIGDANVIRMNDEDNLSFDQIADAVEAEIARIGAMNA